MTRTLTILALLLAFPASAQFNGCAPGFCNQSGSAVGGTVITYIGHNSVNGSSPHTFVGEPIGVVSADRLVVVVVSATNSGAASSRPIQTVSIGGTLANINRQGFNSNDTIGPSYAISSLNVTSGTTADIIITCTGAVSDIDIWTYTITGLTNFNPVSATKVDNASGDPSVTVNVTKNGGIIALFDGVAGTDGATSWAGLATKDYDAQAAHAFVTAHRLSVAHQDGLNTETPRTISSTSTTSVKSLVAASWSDAAAPATTYTAFSGTDLSANIARSGSNLVATYSAAVDAGIRCTDYRSSGKYYFEFTANSTIGGGDSGVGLARAGVSLASLANSAANGIIVYRSGNIWIGSNTGVNAGGSIAASGTVVGIAIDFDNQTFWARIAPSGNWNNNGSANPATNTGGIAIGPSVGGELTPAAVFNASGDSFSLNSGGSAFSGTAPSGFTAGWPVSPSG